MYMALLHFCGVGAPLCSHISNLSRNKAVPIHASPPKCVILVSVSTILLLLLHVSLFCLSTLPLLPASHALKAVLLQM